MLGTAQPNRLYRGRAFACRLNAAEPILDVIAETRRIVDDVERGWKDSLGPLIIDLPSFTTVMDELRPQVEVLLGPEG